MRGCPGSRTGWGRGHLRGNNRFIGSVWPRWSSGRAELRGALERALRAGRAPAEGFDGDGDLTLRIRRVPAHRATHSRSSRVRFHARSSSFAGRSSAWRRPFRPPGPMVAQAARGDFGHEFRPQRLRNTLVDPSGGGLLDAADLRRDAAGEARIASTLPGNRPSDQRRSSDRPLDRGREQILSRLAREPLAEQSLRRPLWYPLDAGLPSLLVSRRRGKA